ncbi:MAG: hypothetical protein DWQ37_08440 [Planctomycetota bacterium]|nr:MAG: hypothetical protein DWQ37_08440 [Planctomycetota bacterium]
MPAQYDKLGIRFLYPDNWTLDEEEALAGNRSVSVHSPGGAFWSITLHDASIDPGELVSAALATLKEEYQDGEATPASDKIGGEAISGYDLNFFYLDLTNTALIRGFRAGNASCLVLCQAEDREFAAVEPVFRAMTTSLLGKQALP